MKQSDIAQWIPLLIGLLLATGIGSRQLLAQEPNPTPAVIDLAPTATATASVPPSTAVDDNYEPNDTAETAVAVTWGHISAALHTGDADYFRLYLKPGQMVQARTNSATQVDTRLELWRDGQQLAANDDRSPADVASEIVFTAAAEGWHLLRVSQGAVATGVYELHLALIAPTPSPSPTATPTVPATPTSIPTHAAVAQPPAPAVSPQSGHAQTGQGAAGAAPASLAPGEQTTPVPVATATVTATTAMNQTAVFTPTIPLRRLGAAAPDATPQVTSVRMLVYYDANNNRQPEPGEGIANVSVLAVDGQGQQLARTFTNLQGEAVFTLTDAAIERVLVPFVSAWSARVRPGMVNEEIVLGLPAVRLPVFLPVAEPEEETR